VIWENSGSFSEDKTWAILFIPSINVEKNSGLAAFPYGTYDTAGPGFVFNLELRKEGFTIRRSS